MEGPLEVVADSAARANIRHGTRRRVVLAHHRELGFAILGDLDGYNTLFVCNVVMEPQESLVWLHRLGVDVVEDGKCQLERFISAQGDALLFTGRRKSMNVQFQSNELTNAAQMKVLTLQSAPFQSLPTRWQLCQS